MADFLKKQIIPILLFTLLCSSVVYIYARSDMGVLMVFTAVSFLYAFLLFAVYEKLRKTGKTVVSTLVIVFVMIASLLISGRMIETSYTVTFQWMLEPSSIKQIFVGNIAALLLDFGFVLGSALYYFTTVRYRSIFVFLICMCPFSLFAKTFTSIPVIYIILIATLFFILMIIKASGGSPAYDKRSYIAFGSFAVIVVSAAAFLPKLESAPYRDEFDELITGISIGGAGGVDFSNFSDSSSYSTSDDDETVVFMFYGDNPIRVKRQCFNSYDSGSGQWEYFGEFDVGYSEWDKYIKWEDPSLLSDKYGHVSQTHTAWVMSAQSKLRALYTPENMTSIALSESEGRNIYRTPMDEYFVSRDNTDTRYYKIEWRSFPYDDSFSAFYGKDVARANSTASYGAGYYKALSDVEKIYSELLTYDVRRKCYRSDKDFAKVSELAKSVTDGCSSAYEKSKAIEAFFLSRDFVYDDDFSPVDSSVENFIFNTRRGVCSDYATAMTLMCREVGLYSRYVEGFLIQKKDEKGNYYVTSADSHAYVQVWLDGYGWTDFDPTSLNIDGGYIDNTFLIFGGCVFIAGVIIIGIIMLAPVIKKRRFMRRVSALNGSEQVLFLFPELNRFLHERFGLKKPVLTISELKERTIVRYDVDISTFVDNYERAAYGGKKADDLDYLELYRSVIRSVKEADKRK